LEAGGTSALAAVADIQYGATVAYLTPTGTAAASAAAGFAAGGIMGGNLQSAVYGAVAGGIGGAAGAALGEFGALGQVVGGGVNGYLQTGTGEGALRGAVAGALPADLGLSEAYRDRWYANVGIGVVRDGVRGSFVEGSMRGFWRGLALGQATNLVGHGVGIATTFNSPSFDRGAFVYEGTFWTGKGAVTFGNVISGSPGISTNPLSRLEYQHERNHIFQGSERALGAAYIPVHMLDIAVGCAGGALGFGTSWYALEQHAQNVPYSALGVNPCARR
jgi:hypothetical protein